MRYCSIIAVVSLACCSLSHAGVLYDGSLNTLPAAQGWYYIATPGAAAHESLGAGVQATVLNTEPLIGESAGYFSEHPLFTALPRHPGVGVLDSSAGFALRFTVQVLFETHQDNDRAGFSVMVLDSNAAGVELGFWTDEIWAQTDSPLFTHSTGEQWFYNTTVAVMEYELAFHGGTYSLSAGGVPLFGGLLKDYSAFDHTTAGLPADPYEIPNFIFLGDDTSRASAEVSIFKVELVPEPATLTLLALGGLAVIRRRRRSG